VESTRPCSTRPLPTWHAGDTIPLGADRTLRVIEARFADNNPLLVVTEREAEH
jgi:hypothetical protein